MNKRKILFWTGIVLACLGLIYALVHWLFKTDLYTLTPLAHTRCGFKQLTGFYCPGCGGTRSILALCKGQLITSVYYHPLPLYVVCLYANFAVRHLFSKHLKPAKFRTLYVILLVVILLGNWFLRNTLLILGHPM
jgi:hypothetical protein